MTRKVVVTGANSGIGKAMALQLAEQGHRVSLVCRSESKGQAAREEIAARAASPDHVRLFLADLAKREDIARVADELRAHHGAIDTLCNNAGVHLNSRYEAEGLEMMFMVNHLAPYLLTHALLPALRESEAPRVVTTSSMGHRGAIVRWNDLQCEGWFQSTIQYCNTKLYNVWFTTELQRRCPELVASCFHPGAVATQFAQDDPGLLNVLMKIGKPLLRSSAKAARTGVLLAVDERAADARGRYFANEKPRKPSSKARDRDAAARLWAESERLTGVRY